MILKLLEDKNGEVQNLAVKWYNFYIFISSQKSLFSNFCRDTIVTDLAFFLTGSVYYPSLGPLVSKVKEYQVETIVDTLCTNMLSDKEQLRDISSIGLKTVIGELPPASSGENTKRECVCHREVPVYDILLQILGGVRKY